MANTSSEKILARLKGLRAQMREGEQALFSIPAIWENATNNQSKACDLVLTNQRIFGFIYTTFPRERLFLDALELSDITAVSIRQKTFEAMFRELLVSDHQKRIYIRATGKKIEDTYTALRGAIADNVPAAQTTLNAPDSPLQTLHLPGVSEGEPDEATGEVTADEAGQQARTASQQSEQSLQGNGPTYSRQRVRQPLERSPLGITMLLVGGLMLEIIGILSWIAFGNQQVGITLLLTGLFAVIIATIARRQIR